MQYTKSIKALMGLSQEQTEAFWREYFHLIAKSINLSSVPKNFDEFEALLKMQPNRHGYSLPERVKYWGKNAWFVTIDTDVEPYENINQNTRVDRHQLWQYNDFGDSSRYGKFRNAESGEDLNLFYVQCIPLFDQFVKKAVDKAKQTSDNVNTENNEGDSEMSIKQKATQTATGLLATNVDAAKNAAFINMGRVGNTIIAEKVAPRMPLVIRGQAKKPAGRLLMANLFAAGIKQFAPENEKLQLVADAMVNEAMLSVFDGFDIEGLTKELLSATAGQLETLTGSSETESK